MMSSSLPSSSLPSSSQSPYERLQAIIGTDAGNRGMGDLIVPGDLPQAAQIIAKLDRSSTVVILSGFPCCVQYDPPTETDGPPGTLAIARVAAVACGHNVIVVTDDCNRAVFDAALNGLALPDNCEGEISLMTFPPSTTTTMMASEMNENRYKKLAQECKLLIACERAGPGRDGQCYTMRGINMTEKGLIAPLHRLVKEAGDPAGGGSNIPFIAIGDGGNELGMGKVIDKIVGSTKIGNGEKIGCVVAADYLIAASVSNWGGYALAAAIAIACAPTAPFTDQQVDVSNWIDRCLPSEQDEIALLNRCVAAGCRDGVSGKLEATVDGMPLETSLQCLRDIREAAISSLNHPIMESKT